MSKVKIESFVDYSDEVSEAEIKRMLKLGYTVGLAKAYLNKLRIQKMFENDNGGKNEDYNRDLFGIPPDRMAKWNIKSKSE